MKALALIALLLALTGCAAVKGAVYYETGLSHPTLVMDRVYLLNDRERADADLLKKLGITVIVGLAAKPDPPIVGKTYWIPIEYNAAPENIERIETTVDLLVGLWYEGQVIGIGCKAAENRGPVVVAKMQAAIYGGSWRDWFELNRIIRPWIYPQAWMDGIK